jgi:competence protein ComGF
MFRTTICGVTSLLLMAGVALADPIAAKVKKVEDNKITVTVDDKDVTYDVAKDVKVTQTTMKKKVPQTQDVSEGLAGVKEDANVKLTVETKDGKESVTKIDVTVAKKKKKKNQ